MPAIDARHGKGKRSRWLLRGILLQPRQRAALLEAHHANLDHQTYISKVDRMKTDSGHVTVFQSYTAPIPLDNLTENVNRSHVEALMFGA